MNYCIIADYFRDEICRGAELSLDALIELLRPNHKVTTRRAHTVTPEFIKSNNYKWIVSNRMNLSEECKAALPENEYIVVENDAAWTTSRDFGLYEDFIPPVDHIVNREFYEKAQKVVMQSKIHEYAIKQALGLTNTVSANGNPWSKSELSLLRELSGVEKTKDFAVVFSPHKSKGTDKAVEVCRANGHSFEIVPEAPREQFLRELAKFKYLVFLPSVFESYGRIAFEFLAMRGSLIHNEMSGFYHEHHSQLKGVELIDFAEANNQYILSLYEN